MFPWSCFYTVLSACRALLFSVAKFREEGCSKLSCIMSQAQGSFLKSLQLPRAFIKEKRGYSRDTLLFVSGGWTFSLVSPEQDREQEQTHWKGTIRKSCMNDPCRTEREGVKCWFIVCSKVCIEPYAHCTSLHPHRGGDGQFHFIEEKLGKPRS